MNNKNYIKSIKHKLSKTNEKLNKLFDILMLNENNEYKFKDSVNKDNYNPDYKKGFLKRYLLTFFTKKKYFNLNDQTYKETIKGFRLGLIIMLFVGFTPPILSLPFLLEKYHFENMIIPLSVCLLAYSIPMFGCARIFKETLEDENLKIEKEIENNKFENLKENFINDKLYYYNTEKNFPKSKILNKEQLIEFLSFIKENLNEKEINDEMEFHDLEKIEEHYTIYKLLIGIKNNYENELECLDEDQQRIRKRNKDILEKFTKKEKAEKLIKETA